MKRIVWYVSVVLMVFISCSKKVHPSAERVTKPKIPAEVPLNGEISSAPTVITPSTPGLLKSPFIVIDGNGQIISSRDKLPQEIAAKVDFHAIARSFTPAQKQNLIYRFKILPPRVLFIPDRLVSKSARGYYCVYRKKFWYWKKDDGLFHLDETYYQ